MINVCTAEQTRAIDRAASEVGGIPSIILMENAAISCVDELKADFADLAAKRVVIFAGKGNNGGDGFCIARHLLMMGVHTETVLVSGEPAAGDALVNYEIIKHMGAAVYALDDILSIGAYIRSADIVVDAIYGTGIHGTVREPAYSLFEKINANARYTLAVDIPSGVDADTGEICGVCVRADKTVTFAAYKSAMTLFPGCAAMGKVVLKHISIPEKIIAGLNYKTHILEDADAAAILPERQADSHKGDYGKVFIVAGSRGMTGAAVMASEAAVRSGAGLVTLGIPASLNQIAEEKLTEAMSLPLSDKDGALAAEAYDAIREKAEKSDVLLFGPGLGTGEDIGELLALILKNSKIPVIVDADGLNVMARDLSILEDSNCDVIITPHEAEMARLIGTSVEYVRKNRQQVSAEFAREYGVTVILKGNHTIVTSWDETQYINMTGNAGMATGGSGDVLAGMTAACVARGVNLCEAAALAVYEHGKAGDRCMQKFGANAVTPTRMIEEIRFVY